MATLHKMFYSVRSKKEKSDLEKVFEDLINKIEIYEKQYEITLKLYKIEWEKEIEKLNKSFGAEEVYEIYNKTYAEYEGEIEDRHDHAAEVSGLYELSDLENKLKEGHLIFFDLYNKSLVTALYSLVESKLKEICDIISIDFDKKLKYKHLDARNYLNTSKNYLDLVAQIPTDSIKPFFTELRDIQFIRNKITHSDSKFSKEKDNEDSEKKEKKLKIL